MARLNTSGLDKLIDEMGRMGQLTGPVAEAMITEAANVTRDAWREAAEEHGLRDTGDMINSIGYPVSIIHLGAALARDIYPQGKDSKGVRNAEKAFILHYGKHGFPATYWVDDAEAKAGPRIQERLEDMWAEFNETGKVPQVSNNGAGSGSGVTKRKK